MPSVPNKHAKEGGVSPTVIELGALNTGTDDIDLEKAFEPNWSIKPHMTSWPPKPLPPSLPKFFGCCCPRSDLYVSVKLLETHEEHKTKPLPNAGKDDPNFEIPFECSPVAKLNLMTHKLEECHLRVILNDDDFGSPRLIGYYGKLNLAPLVQYGQRYVKLPMSDDGMLAGYVYLEIRSMETKDEGTLSVKIIGVSDVDDVAPDHDCSWEKIIIALGVVSYIMIYAAAIYLVEHGTECGEGQYDDFNDCLWFVLVTFTSVGYGDSYPCTDDGRIVNAIFILLNQLTLAWFFNVAVHIAMANAKIFHLSSTILWNFFIRDSGVCDSCRLAEQLFDAKQQVLARDPHGNTRVAEIVAVRQTYDPIEGAYDFSYQLMWQDGSDGGWRLENQIRAHDPLTFERLRSELFRSLIFQGILNGIWIVVGTFTYYYTEKDEPDWGGSPELTLANTFHFSVVTMSTVGYGDWAPTSKAGKVFGSFYILVGVLMLANFATIVIEFFLKRKELLDSWDKLNTSLMNSAQILKFDTNGDQKVDKYEYLARMLIECQFVSEDKIDLIMNKFHNLDKDGSNEIDLNDFKVYEEFLAAQREAKRQRGQAV